MQIKKKIVLALGMVMVWAGSAHAIDISIVGAGTYSNPFVKTGGVQQTYTQEMGFGGGALIHFKTSILTGIEFGALYLQNKYTTPSVTVGAVSAKATATDP